MSDQESRLDLHEYQIKELQKEIQSLKRGTWGIFVTLVAGLITLVLKLLEK